MKKLKKGFTIVELVIVVAVIAILAGVLIPVFSNVVKKANVSKDTQLVRNLNEALATDLNEHNTMYDALQAAKEFGYDVGKINASATDNEILWDSKNDCFVYLNGNTKEYIPNSKKVDVQNEYDFWVISNTPSDKYSTYYTGNATEVTVSTGFDAGEVTGITVNVVTNETRTLTVRTSSKNDVVTATAPNATINFYGFAGEVDVISVDDENCLHVFGQVDFLSVKAGKVIAEEEAIVHTIVITKTEDVTIEVKTEEIKNILVDKALVDTTVKAVIDSVVTQMPSAVTEKIDEIIDQVDTNNADVMTELKETAKLESCNHAWTETVVSVLDCVNDGVVEKKCDYCGFAETITTEATGHVITNTATCETCGEKFSDADMVNAGYVAKAGSVYYKTVAEANSNATKVFYILADSSEDVDISTIKGVVVNAGVNYTGTITGKAVDYVGDSVAYFSSFDNAMAYYTSFAKVSKAATIKLLSDLTISKTIATTFNARVNLTIDLNGYTITSTIASTSSNYLFKAIQNAPLAITSSTEGAKIELGKSGLALVHSKFDFSNLTINQTEASVNEFVQCQAEAATNGGLGIDNVNINIEQTTHNFFKVYGEVNIANLNVNIKFLGSSLINLNGASNVVINGAKFIINEFKVNAGYLFSKASASSLTIKDADITININETYSSYFVNNTANIVIEDITMNIVGLSGSTYTFDKTTAKWSKN